MKNKNKTLVFDLGKTHIKALLFNSVGVIIEEYYQKHKYISKQKNLKYIQVDKIFNKILYILKQISNSNQIDKIIFATHAATAICITNEEKGNYLPVLDYENNFNQDFEKKYLKNQKCSFLETLTPVLPNNILLSKTIYYYIENIKKNKLTIKSIIFYPQYFAWKLSGIKSSEITYLGCHSDLWSFKEKKFSSFVFNNKIQKKIPKITKSWKNLGPVKKEIVEKTNIYAGCRIYCGLHDSNASYYLYEKFFKQSFTLISTGTWIVIFNKQMNLNLLTDKDEMMAKLNVFGQPIPVIRFMGGREFEKIIKGYLPDKKIKMDFNYLLRKKIFPLPAFAESGPFRRLKGKIINKKLIRSKDDLYNLGSLYIALVIDNCLELMHSKNTIIIDGGFIKNKTFLYCLSVLRKKQKIMINNNSNGTAIGAYLLCNKKINFILDLKKISKNINTSILKYKYEWQRLIFNVNNKS